MLIFPDNVAQENHLEYCCPHWELENSYAFCRRTGVPVELEKPQIILPGKKLAPKLKSNIQLLNILSGLINPIIQSGIENNCFFILCDQHLAALRIFSSAKNIEAGLRTGIVPGTVFTEKSCGTNALSLSRKLGRIVTIPGDQHYCILFKTIFCVAGPIAGPDGNMLGYLNISRPNRKEIDSSIALVKILINAAEKEILFYDCFSTGLHAQVFLPPELVRRLTPRELEICLLLLKRLSSKEISSQLHLSTFVIGLPYMG